MGDVLSIIAIAVLLGLVFVSVRMQRAGTAEARAEADARAEGDAAQHERSLASRAEVRAAQARADTAD
jgi:hypothetical protein